MRIANPSNPNAMKAEGYDPVPVDKAWKVGTVAVVGLALVSLCFLFCFGNNKTVTELAAISGLIGAIILLFAALSWEPRKRFRNRRQRENANNIVNVDDRSINLLASRLEAAGLLHGQAETEALLRNPNSWQYVQAISQLYPITKTSEDTDAVDDANTGIRLAIDKMVEGLQARNEQTAAGERLAVQQIIHRLNTPTGSD